MLSPCFSSLVFVVVVFLGTIIQIWFQAYAKLEVVGFQKARRKISHCYSWSAYFLLRDLLFRGSGVTRRHANPAFPSLPRIPLPDLFPGPPHDLSVGSGFANYGTVPCDRQTGGIPTFSSSASSPSRRNNTFFFFFLRTGKGEKGYVFGTITGQTSSGLSHFATSLFSIQIIVYRLGISFFSTSLGAWMRACEGRSVGFGRYTC